MYKREKGEVAPVETRELGIPPALFPMLHMLAPQAFLRNLQEAKFENHRSKIISARQILYSKKQYMLVK